MRPGGPRRSSSGRWAPTPIASQKAIGFPSFAPNKSTPAWEFFQPLWDAQTDKAYDATGQYAFSTYDLMVQTALAVEAGGLVQGERLGAGHVQGRRAAARCATRTPTA